MYTLKYTLLLIVKVYVKCIMVGVRDKSPSIDKFVSTAEGITASRVQFAENSKLLQKLQQGYYIKKLH